MAKTTTGTPPALTAFSTEGQIRWKEPSDDERKVLNNLQGNILKGHGRDHTMNIFFQLGSDVVRSNRVLRELGNFHVTSAFKQLLAAAAFKAAKTPEEKRANDGGTFCALFLSDSGYTALGLAFPELAGNAAFKPGMKKGKTQLGDPASELWEEGFRGNIDGMVLIGDDDLVRSAAAAAEIAALLTGAGCTILKQQAGKAIRNKLDNGLEHFGYVDGRSQPLMLVEDLEEESEKEGLAFWNPKAKLSRALVADPLAKGDDKLAFGSFFVFRKLEQKVLAFKRAEQKLADDLKLTGKARELAGALVVGRFEDGTPVTMSNKPQGQASPKNDFNYAGDLAATRCPFQAHIRKTNPRGSGGFETDFDVEQAHIMARRGITYEDVARKVHPDNLPEAESSDEFERKVAPLLPKGGLGLLFMAYNAELDNQFVFTQQNWANFPGFPKPPQKTPPTPDPGIDGIIGQPAEAKVVHHYSNEWDNPASPTTASTGFNNFVHMQGGEYFFAPSLQFLRELGRT